MGIPSMQVRFSHIALMTNRPEELAAFYVDSFGMKEAFKLNREDGSVWIVYVDAGADCFIEFVGRKEGEAEEKASPVKVGLGHLCLEVEELHALTEALTEKGVSLLNKGIQKGKDGNLQAWIRDPDGNRVELMELSPEGNQMTYRKGRLER